MSSGSWRTTKNLQQSSNYLSGSSHPSMRCCTNTRNSAGEEGRLTEPSAHCWFCFHADTSSTAPAQAGGVWATYSSAKNRISLVLSVPRWDWPSVTQPWLLLALGPLSAVLYLPRIIRKTKNWIRNNLPLRHLVGMLVLVRKNGYNTLQTWAML